jgi:uncharacterized protein YecE (DUF72 family)
VIRIDASGWSDDDWVGVQFPMRIPVSARLARYVHRFDTVELNARFYRWPNDSRFALAAAAAAGSVKAHRGLTQFRSLKLREPWVGWSEFERCWRFRGDRAENAAGATAS